MRKLETIIGVAVCAVVAGCIPGEATVKLSAENIRRALAGEVVEVPMHGDVEVDFPITKWLEDEKCHFCAGLLEDKTNCVKKLDQAIRSAARVLELLLNDGSSATGGVKKVGTNIVYWAKVDTKILFGTEAALCANSNRVAQSNSVLLLKTNGSLEEKTRCDRDKEPSRMKRIREIMYVLEDGCECCGGFYDMMLGTISAYLYDKVTFEIVGDGKPGFKIAVDDTDQIASEELKDVRHWSKIDKDGRKRTGETGVQSIRIIRL